MSKQQDKTVYFVRHGQSVDNVDPVFQGVSSPLTDEGQRQATLIANRLTHIDFDALISSPVVRARQTAEAIAETTGKELILSDLFVERIKPSRIGESVPITNAPAAKVWHDWNATFLTDDPKAKFEDGENYVEIIQRACDAFNYLLERPEQEIVVVTHGYFLRVMLAYALFDEHLNPTVLRKLQDRARTKNTAITVMHHRDIQDQGYAWRLWTYNDHAHFAE